jgi:regulator of cell morphogenesis and NO signaling
MSSKSTPVIDPKALVSDIVKQDYRTAAVFLKFGIEYCCAAKWPLQVVCETKNLEFEEVQKALEHSTRTIYFPSTIRFEEWENDFLIDFIINVHHHYLKKSLPFITGQLAEFAAHHQNKFAVLSKLVAVVNELEKEMLPHIEFEEQVIFPYIRQVTRAYTNKESYGGPLVRTLRKPVENVMHQEHESLHLYLNKMRDLTNQYAAPAGSCINHQVVFSMLQELDRDLEQHLYLENNIVFPRTIEMEKKMLKDY